MAEQWFYLIDGQQYGPVSASDLRQFAASGELLPEDLVWKEGLTDWVPAQHLKGVSFASTAPSPGSVPLQSAYQQFSPPTTRQRDEKYCAECGNLISVRTEFCPHCGVRQFPAQGYSHSRAPNGKNKVTAALLAFFLGGVGVHKFYLGETALGILYLLFFWTFIPALVSCVDIIVLLTMSDERFISKYGSK